MANEFVCFECGRDGTRCDCHRGRPKRPKPLSVEERIRRNESEIAEIRERLRADAEARRN